MIPLNKLCILLTVIILAAIFGLLSVEAARNYQQAQKAEAIRWEKITDEWYLRIDGRSVSVGYYW